MIHELKILPQNYEDVWNDKKKAELRYNDRDYKVGDTLTLKEWDGKKFTGRCWDFYITHIFDDETYLQKGYVMLSIEMLPPF
ncbi:DUF3850 domain-containing protein [Orbus mooreae]|uniref:DUF3850 domain-containing protein n=1 Tax=Orbus mooreae TaxID=3074107 RepID=UPI00370DCD8A